MKKIKGKRWNKAYQPFVLMQHDDGVYSFLLTSENFGHPLLRAVLPLNGYGIEKIATLAAKNKNIKNLDFDCEESMFCVRSKSKQDIEKLYKTMVNVLEKKGLYNYL